MCFPLRFYDVASSVLELSIIFEANAGAVVTHQLAKGMVCSCCPMSEGVFFFSFSSVVGKKGSCLYFCYGAKTLKLKGDFANLLGSFQHNTCVVLSKMCTRLKLDVYT